MKFPKFHTRQLIYVSIFLVVAIVLFIIHALNPAFDHDREAWFSLSLILPGVIPWSLFTGDSRRANFWFITIAFVYGSFIVWLGKTWVFAFLFELRLSNWVHFLVQAMIGFVLYLILFVCARYSDELEAIENI